MNRTFITRTLREDVGMHLSAMQSGILLVLFVWWIFGADSTTDSFYTVGRWLAIGQMPVGLFACWLQYSGRKQ